MGTGNSEERRRNAGADDGPAESPGAAGPLSPASSGGARPEAPPDATGLAPEETAEGGPAAEGAAEGSPYAGTGRPLQADAAAQWTVEVRYGAFETRLLCASDIGDIAVGTCLVVRTDRGTEMAVAISPPRPNRDAVPLRARVLRKANAADIELQHKLESEKRTEAHAFASRLIREHQLKMKLVYVEPLLGGEKMIFYFSADGRVDFRGLVRELAREYRTRIEMRQIGPRDEARLLGEYETCGRRLCCKAFLDRLEPVSMRMAKQQKSTLDPGKISGRCGRLKCCLRFEDRVYAELRMNLPEVGDTVITASLKGEAISCDIMGQKVTVLTAEGERATVRAEEILFVQPPAGGQTEEGGEDDPDRIRNEGKREGPAGGPAGESGSGA
ncbi:MAG: hypothetical protein N3A38_05470 [Planctomycetota bacterium]|nr:hypothetical protein [Planctomycetota bacterium]